MLFKVVYFVAERSEHCRHGFGASFGVTGADDFHGGVLKNASEKIDRNDWCILSGFAVQLDWAEYWRDMTAGLSKQVCCKIRFRS